jgi:hypothetical protein
LWTIHFLKTFGWELPPGFSVIPQLPEN